MSKLPLTFSEGRGHRFESCRVRHPSENPIDARSPDP